MDYIFRFCSHLVSLFKLSHSLILLSSLFISESTVSLGFMDAIDWSEADRFVSSAYIMLGNMSLAFGRSLIYIMKSKGPSMDPCGTPKVSDLALFITTYCFLFCR